MGKRTSNQSGFSILEGFLVLCIVSLISFMGYYSWQTHKTAVKSTTTASSNPQPKQQPATAASPYTGWQTYTLGKAKLTFQYPADWTLKDSATQSDVNTADNISLSGPSDFSMSITTGNPDITCPTGGCNVLQADPVTFLGKTAYLDAWDGSASGNTLTAIDLSQGSDDAKWFFEAKNIPPASKDSAGYISIEMSWAPAASTASATSAPATPDSSDISLNEVADNAQYKEAKLVIESIHY